MMRLTRIRFWRQGKHAMVTLCLVEPAALSFAGPFASINRGQDRVLSF